MFKLCLVLLVIAIHCEKTEPKVSNEYDYYTSLFTSDDETTPTEANVEEGKKIFFIQYLHTKGTIH